MQAGNALSQLFINCRHWMASKIYEYRSIGLFGKALHRIASRKYSLKENASLYLTSEVGSPSSTVFVSIYRSVLSQTNGGELHIMGVFVRGQHTDLSSLNKSLQPTSKFSSGASFQTFKLYVCYCRCVIQCLFICRCYLQHAELNKNIFVPDALLSINI